MINYFRLEDANAAAQPVKNQADMSGIFKGLITEK